VDHSNGVALDAQLTLRATLARRTLRLRQESISCIPQDAVMRVPYQELQDTFVRVLAQHGLEGERAALCARLFADASRDGVASHGLNRFPRFIRTIRNGVVDVRARPSRVAAYGAWERWDGHRGPGNLNAHACMDRAVALAREHGMGCVALANTNHWMRGGSYGWQAADAGAIGICWTNTLPNLPPWGVSDPRVGNNPLIIAVPRASGHVVLDMAMSQFSMGALESYRLRGELLPVPGGYDRDGGLTQDPAAIETSMRPLPIGFWKGSGLALLLDMAGAVLSGGAATHQIPTEPERESGLSQVFIAISVPAPAEASRVADGILAHLHGGPDAREHARYPGERTLETRRRNLETGVPVEPSIWTQVQQLAAG
jgi:3-dehydro-L-gulonate 2-dehydrogenase